MSARDPDMNKTWTAEEIREINMITGTTPETAALLVEQGVLTSEEAAFWMEYRRELDRRADRVARRMRRLRRPPSKTRLEDDPAVRANYERGLALKVQNPRMTGAHIAANIGVSESTWKYWRRRFRRSI